MNYPNIFHTLQELMAASSVSKRHKNLTEDAIHREYTHTTYNHRIIMYICRKSNVPTLKHSEQTRLNSAF